MHLSLESQAGYAEGALAAADARAAHRHLVTCAACAAGVADQLAIIHAIAQQPRPVATGDGWPAIAEALGDGWAVPAPATKQDRPLLPVRRQRWVAAGLLTVGLSVALALGISPPAPADDEIDHFWQEHHRFSSRNSVSARHIAMHRAQTWTHRLREIQRR
jgi:anti-sigma factor RsiW